jgi:hypothetical protein
MENKPNEPWNPISIKKVTEPETPSAPKVIRRVDGIKKAPVSVVKPSSTAASNAQQTSEVSKVSHISSDDTSKAPGIPEVLNGPEISEVPDASETPEMPEISLDQFKSSTPIPNGDLPSVAAQDPTGSAMQPISKPLEKPPERKPAVSYLFVVWMIEHAIKIFWSIFAVVFLIALFFVSRHFIPRTHNGEQPVVNEQHPREFGDTPDEIERLLTRVESHILLPSGKNFEVYTVTDLTPLAGNAFFERAEVGDKVIIWADVRKAILYSPIKDKIIEVSHVDLVSSTSTPSTR